MTFLPGTRRDLDLTADNFALPVINGKPVDLHPPPATCQSSYLNGDFDFDKISVTVGPVHRRLDFSR